MTQPNTAADTFLVSCIDPRVTDDTTFYFNALGRTDRYSEMRVAGAGLAAVNEATPAWSLALFENLGASRQLHGIRKVTFLNHRDCGAMHIWAGRTLSADPAEELRVHSDVLNRAAEAVRARHPDLLVEIKLMDLDGTVRVLPCASCVPGEFRAEAVDPVGRAVAAASLGNGAVIEPRRAAGITPDPQGFAELGRLRGLSGRTDPTADLALLTRGVVDYGLTAEEARQVLESAAYAQGAPSPLGGPERDTAAFLRSRQDRHGRIGREDVLQAARLYRRLGGVRVTAAEAEQRAARIADAEGLAPRPKGIWPFRSGTWLRTMAEGQA
jgi:hypothetical protein